ncbi:MAG: hypothetical protein JKY56_05625 [Kofleriaceae bacterium]|nr:hypothetical protein [Kofleriaceae bacterium]
MNKIVLPLIVGLAFVLSSCVVRTTGPRGHRNAKKKRCHPSQYWDGHHCRHKGKAKGHHKAQKKHKKKHKKKHRKHDHR